MAMMGTGTGRGDDRAQAAAEAAIANPLLDDVNLSGASGILVNITAGPDFTMREFDEVGRTVEEFASEDATVVIGTVLDPDMRRRRARDGGGHRPQPQPVARAIAPRRTPARARRHGYRELAAAPSAGR